MPAVNFPQEPQDEDSWIASNVPLSGRPPIEVSVLNTAHRPDDDCLAMIDRHLTSIDDLTLAAAELILENYSYEHFRDLGVAEDKLVSEETPAAIAAAVQLESVTFYDEEGSTFELSYSAPWDEQHTFDVEFEDGEPVGCAVNG